MLLLCRPQVHEMAMVSAVQEVQKDNVRSFSDYMITVLEVNSSALICFIFQEFFWCVRILQADIWVH